jgi:parallel beta-helix repeat protein
MNKKIIRSSLIFFIILFLATHNKIATNTNSLVETSNEPNLAADPLILIDDDTDFLAFPGYGNKSHPYIIDGFNIEAQTVDDIGIHVTGTTKHFVIRNNDLSSPAAQGDIGIAVIDVAPNTAMIIENHVERYDVNIYAELAEGVIIENNTCAKIGEPGIWINNCPNSRIKNNILHDKLFIKTEVRKTFENTFEDSVGQEYYGIYLEYSSDCNITENNLDLDDHIAGGGISVFRSSRILIDENIVYHTYIDPSNYEHLERGGLYLREVTNSTIFKNTLESNEKHNMYIAECDNLLIANNTLDDSEVTGISLFLTTNSNITYNTIQDHPSYGVEIYSGCENITVHHNHFIDNNIGGSQASDSGINDIWYDMEKLEGNWWNDWTGGDYIIDGTAGTKDLFPLGEPVEIPEFSEAMVISMLLLPASILTVLIIKRKKRK